VARTCVSCEVRTSSTYKTVNPSLQYPLDAYKCVGFYIPQDNILHSHCCESFLHQGDKNRWISNNASFNFETSVLSRATRRNIPEDAILHSHRRENLKSSVAFSPQANHTDWTTANFWRNLVPTFADRGVSRSQRGGSPTDVNLSFFRPEPLLFFQVASHLYSQGLSGHVPDPLLLRNKSGSAGNRTRHLWVCSQEVWPLDHRGGLTCRYPRRKFCNTSFKQ
jgi:hypothetical protein